MDDKKIFDEYGNYNFPTEKKQEGLNTIEEMKMDIIKTFSLEYIYAQSEVMKRESDIDVLVNSLIAKGYRKESDTVKEVLGKVLKFTLDDEVGMRYLLKNLAKEYGVEL